MKKKLLAFCIFAAALNAAAALTVTATNGVASLRIALSGQKLGGGLVQRALFAAGAPADGGFAWTSPVKGKGSYEVTLRFLDSSDGVIDTLVADYEGFADLATVIFVQ